MTLFFSLLPIYIFGNLHCASMCGPLVMLLAKHPYRNWYFWGRLFSFSVAGLLSAEIGVFLFTFLSRWHLAAALSLGFGSYIFVMGACLLMKVQLPGSALLAKKMTKLSLPISKLITQNSSYAVFLFGACTILLPCGQSLVVFSELALNGVPLAGLMHGFLFALLTSPSLIAMMRSSQFFCRQRKGYHMWMGSAILLVGSLSLLRGLSDLDLIKHFILNPGASSQYHIVLF